MKGMNFEILISTMNRTDLTFLDAMFKEVALEDYFVLIINQTTRDAKLESEHHNIRVINSFEEGLSKSRNLAIENARGTVCLLADDDTCFIKGFDTIIRRAFKTNRRAALIGFQATTFEGEPYRTYPEALKRLKRGKDIRPLSSIEIAFKRETILHNSIRFNELFGLKGYFESGEEYLFARDVIRSKLKAYYVPREIVRHSKTTSTGNYESDKVFYTNGALSYLKYRKLGVVSVLKFTVSSAIRGVIKWRACIGKFRMGLRGMRHYRDLIF